MRAVRLRVRAVYAPPVWPAAALSLMLALAGSDLFSCGESVAAGPDVLALRAQIPQGGEVEGETDYLMGDLLLRELVRQAVLIAAREEMGLATRDAALREPMPDDDSASVVDIATIARKRRGVQVTMTHEGEVILDHEELCNIGPVNMYIEFIEKMEKLSRNEFLTALQQTGLQGHPPAEADDGELSPEIEKYLTEMNLLSQYEAARLCHEEIQTAGSSPQRLGALVRAYAHLGQLTQPFFSSMHRTFRARSLLYAQRMIAADPESPWGYWHRAYALSLAGIQRWSYSDLGRANQLAGDDVDDAPPWVELLDAYNRYDYAALKERARAGDGLRQLAGLLWFISVETSTCQSLVLETGSAVLAINPLDMRVTDGMLNEAGVGPQHRLTQAGPEQFRLLLANELEKHASVPKRLRVRYGSGAGAELASPDFRAELATALVAEAGEENDRQEPSLAVLGRMFEEQNVLHIYRRAYFARDMLSVDSAGFLNEYRRTLRDHPYGPLVMAVSEESRSRVDRYQDLVGDVVIGETNMASMRRLFSRIPPEAEFANMTQDEAWDHMWLQMSPLEFEYFLDMRNHSPHNRLLMARWMADVSQHSPYRHYVMITDGWERSQGELSEWEQKYGENPLIQLAFAEQYARLGETEKAIAYYQRHLSQVSNTPAAVGLARLYYAEDNGEWLTTLKRALEYPDYGLDNAHVNCHIAATLMQENEYEKALPFAEAAADSYSAWSLLCLAFCLEGLGRHAEADEIVQAEQDRYTSSNQYYWCVRTGRGDLEGAFSDYKRLLRYWYPTRDDFYTGMEFRHLIYTDQDQAALELATEELDELTQASDRLAAAMLAEEFDNDDLAQKLINELAEGDVPVEVHEMWIAVAQFLQELREMQKFDKESIDALLDSHPDAGSGAVLTYLGWHLANIGETELAAEYLTLISGSRRWDSGDILYAQMKLRDVGLELADIPRRYPYGMDKD